MSKSGMMRITAADRSIKDASMKRFIFIPSRRKKNFDVFTIIMFFSFCLILASRYVQGFADQYATIVYPVHEKLFSGFFSAWRYSCFEAGVLLLVLIIFFGTAACVLFLFVRRTKIRKYLAFQGNAAAMTLAILVLIYTLNCGINYQRASIKTELKLPNTVQTKDQLIGLCLILTEEIEVLSQTPSLTESMKVNTSLEKIQDDSISAMEALGSQIPSLSGPYPRPKPVYFSSVLSDLGIEGIYSPFTMEANYNASMTSFLIPYTICHELAHLKGYMKEEDAGFLAFLACTNSPSEFVRYSGYFHALQFALLALQSETNTDEFNQVFTMLPPSVQYQLQSLQADNQRERPLLLSASKSVNNAYLKANAQSGTKTYGLMLDLLLSYYAKQINGENLI